MVPDDAASGPSLRLRGTPVQRKGCSRKGPRPAQGSSPAGLCLHVGTPWRPHLPPVLLQAQVEVAQQPEEGRGEGGQLGGVVGATRGTHTDVLGHLSHQRQPAGRGTAKVVLRSDGAPALGPLDPPQARRGLRRTRPHIQKPGLLCLFSASSIAAQEGAPVERRLIDAAHLVEHKQARQQHRQRENLGAVLARLHGGQAAGREILDTRASARNLVENRQTNHSSRASLCFCSQAQSGAAAHAFPQPPRYGAQTPAVSAARESRTAPNSPGHKHQCPLCPAAPANRWIYRRCGAQRGWTTSTGLGAYRGWDRGAQWDVGWVGLKVQAGRGMWVMARESTRRASEH